MAIKKRPVSPRQKMINLMYVVLMAMLALNVSTEVLNGFSIVEESLNRTTNNSSKENQALVLSVLIAVPLSYMSSRNILDILIPGKTPFHELIKKIILESRNVEA
jgi:hypothetical protein